MIAYLREHALLVILIVVVAAVGVGIISKQDQGTSTGGAKAPVECSIDGNFENDAPGCVTNHKP